MTDHERALALANRIAEAWGLDPMDDIGQSRRDVAGIPCTVIVNKHGDGVLAMAVGWSLADRKTVAFWIGLEPGEPMPDGICDYTTSVAMGYAARTDIARDRLRIADAATNGLISHRLQQAGETAWLDWLYPREDNGGSIHSV